MPCTPFVCGTYTNVASFMIQALGFNSPVTIGYEFLSGTATAGVDFTGPYTGSVTIQPNFPQASVSVPVVNDGIAEPSETLSLRITSVSANANIGPPGQTTIFDGGNMPVDCNPARTFSSSSITCTSRPASSGGSPPAAIAATTGPTSGPGSSPSTATPSPATATPR